MPRRSEKSYFEESLLRLLRTEMLMWAIIGEEDDHVWEDLAIILWTVRGMRYLHRRTHGSAGRVLYAPHFDMIDQYLNFPEDSFRARFRMSHADFDAVVDLLGAHSTAEDWRHNSGNANGGPIGRPMRKQIAIALYIMGGQEETLEKVRGTFGVAKGTAFNYLWRTIIVTCRLVTQFIQWPTKEQQRLLRQTKEQDEDEQDFAGCIGYLDGSDVVLNEKPQRDWELYYGRKSVYGFNLQAVCNDNYEVIYAQITHRVSAHDSAAFKASTLYRHREILFDEDAYILADKAYEIDKHVITPFRQNAAETLVPYQPFFNLALSNKRIRVEHTFGQVKERFQSFYSLPTHIRAESLAFDLKRVQHWTLACICIHNFLRKREAQHPIPDQPLPIAELSARETRIHSATHMRRAGELRRAELAHGVYRRFTQPSLN